MGAFAAPIVVLTYSKQYNCTQENWKKCKKVGF